MRLQRRLDWRSRLHVWAAEQIGKTYEWGATDCGSLVREALIVMFGDAMKPLLPTWGSARGALITLRREGSVGHQLERLGAVQSSLPFLRAGDIIVAAEPDEAVGRFSLMICVDGQQCLASTKEGVSWSAPVPEGCAYSLWEVTVNG